MDRLLEQFCGHWLWRSLGAGVVSTVVEVAMLFLAVHALRLPTVSASALGIVAGCLHLPARDSLDGQVEWPLRQEVAA